MQQKMSFADKIAYMFMFSSPVLTGNTLSGWSAEGTAEGTAEEDDGGQLSSQFLTVRGTAFKALWLSGLFFSVCMVCRYFAAFVRDMAPAVLIYLLLACAVLSVIMYFCPQSGPFMAVPFCIAEGLAVSGAAGYADISRKMMFGDAVFSAAAAVLAMLAVCCFSGLKLKSGNGSVIVGALFGPLVYYALSLAISSTAAKGMFSFSPWILLCSFILSAAAACNITQNFAIIHAGAEAKTHKVMEWYCAFALMFNLLWFYFELFFIYVLIRFAIYVVPMLYGFY